jgi:hypothetical protein
VLNTAKKKKSHQTEKLVHVKNPLNLCSVGLEDELETGTYRRLRSNLEKNVQGSAAGVSGT